MRVSIIVSNRLAKFRTRRTVHFASHDDVEIADFPADDAEEYAMWFLCHRTCAQFFETITENMSESNSRTGIKVGSTHSMVR